MITGFKLFLEQALNAARVLKYRLDREEHFPVENVPMNGLRGYILPDGSILNFGHDDHRSIATLYMGELNESDGFGDINVSRSIGSALEHSNSKYMIDFMNRMGAIRFSSYNNGRDAAISFIKKPTKYQIYTILRSTWEELRADKLTPDYKIKKSKVFVEGEDYELDRFLR